MESAMVAMATVAKVGRRRRERTAKRRSERSESIFARGGVENRAGAGFIRSDSARRRRVRGGSGGGPKLRDSGRLERESWEGRIVTLFPSFERACGAGPLLLTRRARRSA